MVYCPKCGTENEEDTQYCVECGASLYTSTSTRIPKEKRDECFGLPGGSSIVGILIGLAIILVGARELFGWNIDIGPFAAIVVGVLIIAGAIYKQSQRKP